MDKNTVKCVMCEWQGVEEDLIFGEDEEGGFHGCPKCKTDNYLMDVDYEE